MPRVGDWRRCALAVLAGLALAGQASSQDRVVLGRCPLENATAVVSGRFVASDIDDLLVVQDLGKLDLSAGGAESRTTARLYRLALLRLAGSRLVSVWESRPMMGEAVLTAGVAPSVWAAGDVDADGRCELLTLAADSGVVHEFEPEGARTMSVHVPGAWATDAELCDADGDGGVELVTVEANPQDAVSGTRMLRVYGWNGNGFTPVSGYVAGMSWNAGAGMALIGRARLEDYEGELPIVAGIHSDTRPSLYGVVHEAGPDSFCYTTNPFPYAEWFSKDRVLPAGDLSIFNVGDTLVAYGYFVPGSRPGGPPRSFAALRDGEWQLLRIGDNARRLEGPVCRFEYEQQTGWLELREDVFHFYPGEIFHWR